MEKILIAVIIIACWSYKEQKQPTFKDIAEDPVILAPGAEGEWDAGALGSMTLVKVNGVYPHVYGY